MRVCNEKGREASAPGPMIGPGPLTYDALTCINSSRAA